MSKGHTITQQKAVNNLRAEKVRSELSRREWTVSRLAKTLGIKPATLTNILCGANPGKAQWLKIEEVLGMPIVSSSDEFIARLDTPEKIKAYKLAVVERACGQLAGLENFGRELQQITAALGLHIVVCQFDASPKSPVWKLPNTGEPFAEEIAAARAGQFDSVRMQDGSYFSFYHVSDLGKALEVLKRGLEQHKLLDHARLFYIEAETSGWRMVWPNSAELILPSPWNI